MKRIKRRLKRKMQEFKEVGPERRRGRRGSLRRRGGGGDAMGALLPAGLDRVIRVHSNTTMTIGEITL